MELEVGKVLAIQAEIYKITNKAKLDEFAVKLSMSDIDSKARKFINRMIDFKNEELSIQSAMVEHGEIKAEEV